MALFSNKYANSFAHELTDFCFSGCKTKDLHDKLQSILNFRNRIFHHEAIIYMKDLNKVKNNVIELLYKLDDNVKNILPLVIQVEAIYKMEQDIDIEKITVHLQKITGRA